MTSISSYIAQLPHRRAWTLAWPMILSNISVPLMGLADTAMLGHLDDATDLAAVAIGANVIALLYWMCAFLRMGTTSVTATAIGAQQPDHALLHLIQNTTIAIGLSLLLLAGHGPLFPFILDVMSDDDALSKIANIYCDVRVMSAPAALITLVATGWLIGLGNTKAPLIITVSANLLNVGLDYLFIVQWQMGAQGAAQATVIAECVGCTIAVFAIAHEIRKRQWRFTRWFDSSALKRNLQISSDLFIRTTLLLLAFNFFNAQSARLGTDVLAANAVLFQCTLFVSFFLDGYALAAENMTASALGGKSVRRFHQASAVTSITAVGIALALTLLFAIGGKHIILLLTDLPDIISIANEFLPWLIAIPMLSVGCYALDGIFIGAGKTSTMKYMMVVSVFLVFVPAWWFTQNWGNHGLWFAFALFNLSRGVTLLYAYFYISSTQSWLSRN